MKKGLENVSLQMCGHGMCALYDLCSLSGVFLCALSAKYTHSNV